MSQIKSKFGMILCLLLVMVTFIPAASSKYVKSYPIDLSLKTVLAQGKLYWTDKAGEMPDVYTFPSAEDKANFQDGYYMIIAKGGNGADGSGAGGYGGIVAGVYKYNPATGTPITIALGSSASSTACGYNALHDDANSYKNTTTGVLRGGYSPNSIYGGAATTVIMGDLPYSSSLVMLAAGGGGGGYSSNYSGGIGGSNILTTGTESYYDQYGQKGVKIKETYYYYGQNGGGYSSYGDGGKISNADYGEYGAESMSDCLYGGNGGPYTEGTAKTCGGAGYVGGWGNDADGGGGGGSSLVSRNFSWAAEPSLVEYKDAMNNLIGSTDGLPSGIYLNDTGYLCNSNGSYSDISFVGIYYIGETLN